MTNLAYNVATISSMVNIMEDDLKKYNKNIIVQAATKYICSDVTNTIFSNYLEYPYMWALNILKPYAEEYGNGKVYEFYFMIDYVIVRDDHLYDFKLKPDMTNEEVDNFDSFIIDNFYSYGGVHYIYYDCEKHKKYDYNPYTGYPYIPGIDVFISEELKNLSVFKHYEVSSPVLQRRLKDRDVYHSTDGLQTMTPPTLIYLYCNNDELPSGLAYLDYLDYAMNKIPHLPQKTSLHTLYCGGNMTQFEWYQSPELPQSPESRNKSSELPKQRPLKQRPLKQRPLKNLIPKSHQCRNYIRYNKQQRNFYRK